MIRNELKSKYETSSDPNTYEAPDVWYTEIIIPEAKTLQENGKNSFTVYKLVVDTTFPAFKGQHFEVSRRYNDFVWIHNHLQEYLVSRQSKRPTEPLPPLPGDSFSSFFGWGRFEPDFVEDRRKRLQTVINQIANHPFCAKEAGLIRFLTEENMEQVVKDFALSP